MPIIISPYQPAWPSEFQALARSLRAALGSLAVRIDHIGSTSVPDLPAKDIIDIQVSVRAFEPAVETALRTLGYMRRQGITADHVPRGNPGESDPALWVKWYFTPPETLRPMHMHVRMLGRPNQRYALLFRDFLRANPTASLAYAQVKVALARLHPDDIDAYLDVKDPVIDIIMTGAELWAASSGWQLGPTDA